MQRTFHHTFDSQKLSLTATDQGSLRSRGSMSRLLIASLLTVGISGGMLLSGCQKKEETKVGAKTVSSTPVDASNPLNLKSSVVASLPKDTLGFYALRIDHPDFKKVLQSAKVKGVSGSTWATAAQEMPALAALKDAGLDLSDTDTLAAHYSELTVFIVPDGASDMQVSAALKAKPGYDLKQEISKIEAGFKAHGIETASTSVNGIQATVISIAAPAPEAPQMGEDGSVVEAPKAEPTKIYIAHVGPVLLATVKNPPSAAMIASLNSTTPALPDLVNSGNFLKTLGTSAQNSYAIGYADVTALEARSRTKDAATGGSPEVPVKSVGLSISYSDFNRTDVHALLDLERSPMMKDGAAALSAVPDSVRKLLPEHPMLTATVSSEWLRRLIQATEAQQAKNGAPAPSVLAQYPLLKEIGRVGIGLQAAPVGQSILPIPFVSIIFETNKSKELAGEIGKTIEASVKGSQFEQAVVGTERKIGEVSVKQFGSPLGFSATIVPASGAVVITNSEALAQSAALNTPSAAANPSKAHASVYESPSLFTFLFDGKETVSMVENMGGVLSMYGAQQNADAKDPSKELAESLKAQGTSTGSATINGDLLTLKIVSELI